MKKSERQGDGNFYDVLACLHAVPADRENTFRKAASCPTCAEAVARYKAEHERSAA